MLDHLVGDTMFEAGYLADVAFRLCQLIHQWCPIAIQDGNLDHLRQFSCTG